MIQQLHSWAYIWEDSDLERYMHPSVHSSIIYNRHDTEATWESINRGMGKKDVVYIYAMNTTQS